MNSKETLDNYFDNIKVVEVTKEFPGLNYGDSLKYNEDTNLFELREKYDDNRSVKINKDTIRQYFGEYFKDITRGVMESEKAKSLDVKVKELEDQVNYLKKQNDDLLFIVSKFDYINNSFKNYFNQEFD